MGFKRKILIFKSDKLGFQRRKKLSQNDPISQPENGPPRPEMTLHARN
jgi:hypothetical protein